jgi:hypothetical protein
LNTNGWKDYGSKLLDFHENKLSRIEETKYEKKETEEREET